MVPEELGITLDKALARGGDLKGTYDSDGEIRELIDLARRIEGLARNVGTHAAAVVIADRPLTEYVPLSRVGGKDDIITQWSMGDVEAAGDTASPLPHGTITAQEDDGVVVAAEGGKLLRVKGLTCTRGAIVIPAQADDLRVGARLPDMPADDIAALDRHTVAAAKAETFWMAQSACAAGSEAAPYPRAMKPAHGEHKFVLDTRGDVGLGLAALAARARARSAR